MTWKALSRQFRADWFELLIIVIVGPLIGLGISYAAKAFDPVVTPQSPVVRSFERRRSPNRATPQDLKRQSGVTPPAKAVHGTP